MNRSIVPCVLACFALAAPLPGVAQSGPGPAPTPIPVPTLPPAPNSTTQTIINTATGIINGILQRNQQHAANNAHGVVTYFKRFDLQVRMGSNSYRTIQLHQGTIINPRGATIEAGNIVDVSGVGQSDGSLAADVITIDR